MPRYDYRCKACGNHFELRQSFDSEPVADCTECGAPSPRQIHAPPVIFKGSGWYVNDYGKGRGNNGINRSDRSDSSDGEKSSSKSKSGSGKTEAAASASGGSD